MKKGEINYSDFSAGNLSQKEELIINIKNTVIMRKFKYLLLLAFIGLTTSVFGQDVMSGYNRIYVGYTGIKTHFDFDDADNLSYPGFSIGYLRGINLTQKLPLYLEVGGALQFNRYSESVTEDGYTLDYKETLLGLNIPVSLVYRFNITDDFAISPDFGFNFRLNLMGKGKYEAEGESGDFNLFDDAEMDEMHPLYYEGYNRFQVGWHIGVGFDYKALHLGVDWGTDFNEIAELTKLRTTYITLGWNF